MNSTLDGPAFMTGGRFGPESSALGIVLVGILCLAALLKFERISKKK